MSLIWVLVVLVSVILAVFIFKRFFRHPAIDPVETVEEVNPLEGLVRLNLDIRKEFIGHELVAASEQVIDKLISLIPQVKDYDSAGGELAWAVNRIATEYLPNKCIRPFIKLDRTKRADSKVMDSFKTNISALNKELDDVAALLSARDVNEFNNKAKFLQHRFNTNGEA